MKTIVVSGMVVKTGERVEGDYADIEEYYYVDDSVTTDDVIYFINSYSGRPRTIAAKTDGSKLSFFVSVDSERKMSKHEEKKAKVLNRVGLQKAIHRDMDNLDWQRDEKRRPRK